MMNEWKWIDANERTPPENEKVLITLDEPLLKDGPCVDMGIYSLGGWFLPGIHAAMSVTHWMPLPEPSGKHEQAEYATLEEISSEPVMTITLRGIDAILAFWARRGEAGCVSG